MHQNTLEFESRWNEGIYYTSSNIGMKYSTHLDKNVMELTTMLYASKNPPNELR